MVFRSAGTRIVELSVAERTVWKCGESLLNSFATFPKSLRWEMGKGSYLGFAPCQL